MSAEAKIVSRPYRVTVTREYYVECVCEDHAKKDALEQDYLFGHDKVPVIEVEELP